VIVYNFTLPQASKRQRSAMAALATYLSEQQRRGYLGPCASTQLAGALLGAACAASKALHTENRRARHDEAREARLHDAAHEIVNLFLSGAGSATSATGASRRSAHAQRQ
jgi:hypothetical protein